MPSIFEGREEKGEEIERVKERERVKKNCSNFKPPMPAKTLVLNLVPSISRLVSWYTT